MNPYRLRHETLFAIWHLWRGGLSDAAEIGLLVGEEMSEDDFETALCYVEKLVKGPLKLEQSVRCGYCGGVITRVYCETCRPKRPSYRLIEKRFERSATEEMTEAGEPENIEDELPPELEEAPNPDAPVEIR